MILYTLEVVRGLGEVEIIYTRCEPDPTTSSDMRRQQRSSHAKFTYESNALSTLLYIQQSRFRENFNEANLRQNCM